MRMVFAAVFLRVFNLYDNVLCNATIVIQKKTDYPRKVIVCASTCTNSARVKVCFSGHSYNTHSDAEISWRIAVTTRRGYQ